MKLNNFFALLIIALIPNLFVEGQMTGHWQILKTRNEVPGRNECGMVALNGKLYLIGGDGQDFRAVESFNLATSTWSSLAKAPLDMHHFQAVAFKNKIYILEAFSEGGFPDQIPMANVYIYDTEKNAWQKGAEIPAGRRRAGAGAVEYHGKLYLVAGIQHGHSSGTTNMFDRYDPQTDTWEQLPNAPNIRDHCSATILKDKLYLVGGRNTSYHEPNNFMAFFAKTVTDVDCYDFKTGTWSTLSAKLPLGSGGGAVVTLNDKLYYMGGERATATTPNASQKNTYFLDSSSSSSWIEIDSLNKARNGMAAVVLNNKIYIAGGSGEPGGGPRGPGNPGRPSPGMRNTGTPNPDSMSRNGFPPPPPPSGMNGANESKLCIEVFELK